MEPIELKEHVQRAIRTEWPAFAAEHPKLAAVLDETILVQAATAALRDDPEYRAAMERAAVQQAAAGAVAAVVSRLIGRWLRGLW